MSKVIDKLTDARMAEVDKAMKREKLAREMTHLIPQSAGEAIVDTRERMGLIPRSLGYTTIGGEPVGDSFSDMLTKMADAMGKGQFEVGGMSIDPLDFVNPVAGIFGGKLAKTADLMALRDAMNRAAQGEDVRKVWQDTGWFQSPDGQWRFEIDDSASQLTQQGQGMFTPGMIDMTSNAPDRAPLSDVLQHDQLFPAYDRLGKIEVRRSPSFEGGSYSAMESVFLPKGQLAEVMNVSRSGSEPRSTMLHELQHAIQQREGFARGGSPEQFRRPAGIPDIYSYDDLRDAAIIDQMMRSGRDQLQAFELFKKRMNREPSGRAFSALERVGRGDQLQAARDEMKRFADPQSAYERLAGEAEARAVQSRMNLTPEQRRMRFPLDDYDVPVDELIMRYGDGPAMSAGNRWYHGTSRNIQGGFKPRTFFTKDPNYADNFARQGTELDNRAPAIYPVELDTSRFLDTRREADMELLKDLMGDAGYVRGLDWDFADSGQGINNLPGWGDDFLFDVVQKAGYPGLFVQERPLMESALLFDPSLARSLFDKTGK